MLRLILVATLSLQTLMAQSNPAEFAKLVGFTFADGALPVENTTGEFTLVGRDSQFPLQAAIVVTVPRDAVRISGGVFSTPIPYTITLTGSVRLIGERDGEVFDVEVRGGESGACGSAPQVSRQTNLARGTTVNLSLRLSCTLSSLSGTAFSRRISVNIFRRNDNRSVSEPAVTTTVRFERGTPSMSLWDGTRMIPNSASNPAVAAILETLDPKALRLQTTFFDDIPWQVRVATESGEDWLSIPRAGVVPARGSADIAVSARLLPGLRTDNATVTLSAAGMRDLSFLVLLDLPPNSIQISSVTPDATERLLITEDIQISGEVTMRLGALQAIREVQVLSATGGVIAFQRASTTGDPATASFSMPAFRAPTGTTSLRLRARLLALDGTTQLAVSPEIRYEVVAGKDSVEILSVSPPAGPVPDLLNPVSFSAMVAYEHFRSAATGLVLEVADEGGAVVRRSDPVTVLIGSGRRTLTLPAVTIPVDNQRISLYATLVDAGTGAILLRSTPIVYGARPVDLVITSLEPVQVLHYLPGQIPLVAGKPTVVRVFVRAFGGSGPTPGVTATLSAKLPGGGTALPALIRPFTEPLTPIADRVGEAFIDEESIDFKLSDDWVKTPGELEVTATLVVPATVNDLLPANNSKTVKMTLVPAPFSPEAAVPGKLRIGWLPLCFGPDNCATGPLPGKEFLEKVYPLPAGSVETFRAAKRATFRTQPSRDDFPATFNGELDYESSVLEWESDIATAVRGLFRRFPAEDRYRMDQLVAMRPRLPATDYAGLADTRKNGGEGRTILMVDGQTAGFGRNVLAHEVGHNLGLRHVPLAMPPLCNRVASDDESTVWWPYSDPTIQFPGYDASLAVPRRVEAATNFDLMSYCATAEADNIWISPFHYLTLFNNRLSPSLAPGTPKAAVTVGKAAAQEYWELRGTVAKDGLTGTLAPIFRLTTESTPLPTASGSPYCVRFSGASGLLGTHCFPLSFRHEESGKELRRAAFSFLVSSPAGTTRVTLFNGTRELAALAPGSQPPAVTIVTPRAGERWEATSSQQLAWAGTGSTTLSYLADYSFDGGKNWIPISPETTDTRLTIDSKELTGGTNVYFRVTVSDGFSNAVAQVGPITIAQTPRLAATTGTLDFRKTVLAQSAVQAATITNTGTGPLRVTAAAFSDGVFSLVSPAVPFDVEAGANQQVEVRFNPLSAGARAGMLALTSTGGAAEIQLRGTGLVETAADAEVSPGSVDFGAVPVGGSKTMTVTIRSFGPAALRVSSMTTAGAGFRSGTAGALTVAAGASRVVEVQFGPSAVGAQTGTLTIATNDPARPNIAITLRATGVAPGAGGAPVPQVAAGGVVSAASFLGPLSAGQVAVLFGTELSQGTAAASSVPLATQLAGTRVLVGGTAAPLFYVSPTQINFQVPFEATEGSVPVLVERDGIAGPAATVTVAASSLEFFTYARAGSERDPILVHLDNSLVTPANPARAGEVLLGYVTGLGAVSNRPASGASSPAAPLAAALQLPVVTLGGAPVPVLFAGLTPGGVGLGQLNLQLPAALPAGGCLPLVMRVGGVQSQIRNLATTADGCTQVAAPRLVLGAGSVEFGGVAVGQTVDRTVTVSNGGTAGLTVTALRLDGPFAVVSPATPFSLAAGGSQVVTLRFRPVAAGAAAGNLVVTSNDPGSPATVTVAGVGLAVAGQPSLGVPASLAFGSAVVGQAVTVTASLANTGTAELAVSGLAVTGAAFSLEGAPTLPFSIAAGGQRVLSLRMAPVAAGAQMGELRVSSNDPARPATVISLTGTGTAPVVNNPVPVLAALVPGSITAGSSAFTLTVTGSAFATGATVNWNGSARATTFVSATQLQATVPAADVVLPGTAEVAVTNPAPGGGRSAIKLMGIGPSGGPAVLAQQFAVRSCPLLTAYVSAIDRAGNVITSLGTANFRCSEDGQPVNCAVEPASAETGISVALVVDTGVTAGELDTERTAAAAAIAQLLPDDRVALYQAGSTEAVMGGFTSNKSSVISALGAITAGGTGSATYDAIDGAIRGLAAQTGRRRAVLVLTGTENVTGTLRSSAVLLERARTAGTPIFVLSFGAATGTGTVMRQLALDTAGQYLATSGNLGLQAERVGQIMANQHVVSWSSSFRDGAFHAFGLTFTGSQGSAGTTVYFPACR